MSTEQQVCCLVTDSSELVSRIKSVKGLAVNDVQRPSEALSVIDTMPDNWRCPIFLVDLGIDEMGGHALSEVSYELLDRLDGNEIPRSIILAYRLKAEYPDTTVVVLAKTPSVALVQQLLSSHIDWVWDLSENADELPRILERLASGCDDTPYNDERIHVLLTDNNNEDIRRLEDWLATDEFEYAIVNDDQPSMNRQVQPLDCMAALTEHWPIDVVVLDMALTSHDQVETDRSRSRAVSDLDRTSVNLKYMGGIEFLRQLVQTEYAKRVSVLVYSWYAERDLALALGAEFLSNYPKRRMGRRIEFLRKEEGSGQEEEFVRLVRRLSGG